MVGVEDEDGGGGEKGGVSTDIVVTVLYESSQAPMAGEIIGHTHTCL